jgi:hypothetical protein
MWTEAVVPWFELLPLSFRLGNDKGHQQLRADGLQTDMWTRVLQNTELYYDTLDHNAR